MFFVRRRRKHYKTSAAEPGSLATLGFVAFGDPCVLEPARIIPLGTSQVGPKRLMLLFGRPDET